MYPPSLINFFSKFDIQVIGGFLFFVLITSFLDHVVYNLGKNSCAVPSPPSPPLMPKSWIRHWLQLHFRKLNSYCQIVIVIVHHSSWILTFSMRKNVRKTRRKSDWRRRRSGRRRRVRRSGEKVLKYFQFKLFSFKTSRDLFQAF